VTFTGIPLAALDFYEDLETDNSKAFWTAHKNVYDESSGRPWRSSAPRSRQSSARPSCSGPTATSASPRTSPRTRPTRGCGSGSRRATCTSRRPGCSCRRATGTRPRRRSGRLRVAVADTSRAPRSTARCPVRRSGLTVGGNQLTRVPPGYPKDHPRADWLRHKTMTVSREFGRACLARDHTRADRDRQGLLAMTPLIDWLDTHVGAADTGCSISQVFRPTAPVTTSAPDRGRAPSDSSPGSTCCPGINGKMPPRTSGACRFAQVRQHPDLDGEP